MSSQTAQTDVLIIGAGPIGLEMAVALRDAGVDYLHVEAGAIGQTITWYPRGVQFFSSPERIAICGVPLNTAEQTKATREEYLAYLRGVVEQFDLPVRTHERVTRIDTLGNEGFDIHTHASQGDKRIRAKRVVFAIGDMHAPRMLDIPGEDLPHVSHYFVEPHAYFRRKLLVVGGKNSAVEAALRCHRAGADVTIAYRGDTFADKTVKYWLLPEINWLIDQGAIAYRPGVTPTRITPTHVELADANSGKAVDAVDADFVLLLTGYVMDTTLLEGAGVELAGENRAPRFDNATMETNVPGLFVAGTAAAGTQKRFRLFIENCHPHVIKISRAIAGTDPTHINPLGYRRLHENPFDADERTIES